MLCSATVELLLNFAWVCVSLLLIVWQIRGTRARKRGAEWRVIVALGLLLVLLLPVISITDDLMALNAAAEVEHIVRRQHDLSSPLALLVVLEWMVAAAFLLGCLRDRRLRVRNEGLQLRYTLLGVFAGSGVRPPPALATL